MENEKPALGYAVVKIWRDNPTVPMVIEYFNKDQLREAFEFVKKQKKSLTYSWDVMRYE